MRLFHLVLLALAASSLPAKAEVFRVTQIDDTSMGIIETTTIKREHDLAIVWIYTEFWKPTALGDQRVTRVKTKALVDCKSDRMRVLMATPYETTGKALPGLTGSAPAPWINIPPGSTGVATLDAACRNEFKQPWGKPKWSDYEEMVRVHRDALTR